MWNNRNGKIDLERCAKDWQHAFIASFPGSKIDESEYAGEVIQHIGAKPHYWVFDNDQSVQHVVDSVWAMEEVYGGIAVPVWSLYRQMRCDNIIVSIDGHGGDELLCGYTWYLDWPMNKVNENLMSDFHRTLLPSILRNYDRCSMAHGIEVRMPFMDWRLVVFVFGLSADSKIGGGYTKRILRDAMAGIMPEKIRKRTSKIGFNSPMIEWYNNGLSQMINKIVNLRFWLESPFWNGEELRAEVLTKTSNRSWTYDDWSQSLYLWTLMNVVIWHLLFIERSVEGIQ
jgi:asparagine synthetase B (glutamine-hydrolysing)